MGTAKTRQTVAVLKNVSSVAKTAQNRQPRGRAAEKFHRRLALMSNKRHPDTVATG
jgi:hypothetical protein